MRKILASFEEPRTTPFEYFYKIARKWPSDTEGDKLRVYWDDGMTKEDKQPYYDMAKKAWRRWEKRCAGPF